MIERISIPFRHNSVKNYKNVLTFIMNLGTQSKHSSQGFNRQNHYNLHMNLS